jgi:hypothetical protein
MPMKKMLVLMTNIVLLGSAGIAGADEIAGAVRLTAAQMDKITAGADLNIGDVVIFEGVRVRVELHNVEFLNFSAHICPPCVCPPLDPLPTKANNRPPAKPNNGFLTK